MRSTVNASGKTPQLYTGLLREYIGLASFSPWWFEDHFGSFCILRQPSSWLPLLLLPLLSHQLLDLMVKAQVISLHDLHDPANKTWLTRTPRSSGCLWMIYICILICVRIWLVIASYVAKITSSLVLTFHFLLAKTFKSIQWEPDFAWLQRYARWCGQPCGHRNAAWRIPSGCPWARWLVGYCSWGFNETLMGLSQPSNRVPRSSLILGKCSLSYYQNQLDNKNLCSTKHGAWSHNLSIAREWHKALAHFGPQAYGASTVAVLCLQGVPLIHTWRPPKSFGRCYISYWKLHFFWKYCVSIVNFQGGAVIFLDLECELEGWKHMKARDV